MKSSIKRARAFIPPSLILAVVVLFTACAGNEYKPSTYRDLDIVDDAFATIDLRDPEAYFWYIRYFKIYREEAGRRDPVPVLLRYDDNSEMTSDDPRFKRMMYLRPGRYRIDARVVYPSFSDSTTAGVKAVTVYGWVDLKAQHRYVLKGRRCRWTCLDFFGGRATTWFEDETTGEVVLGNSQFAE